MSLSFTQNGHDADDSSSKETSSAQQSHADHHYRDDGDDEYNDADMSARRSGGFLAQGCYHLQHHWKILVLGQVLSVLLASAGAAQATLHLNCDLSAPTFTMGAIYLILAVVHFTLLSWRQGKERQQQRQHAHDTHQVLLVDQPRYDFGGFQLQRPVWQYAIMAILDVEANAITMLSFKYTTLTSITLLDALAIPSAMLISKYFLGRQYTWVHLLGVVGCMLGVVINVLQDAKDDLDATKIDEKYPHKLLGDILATIGGILYGLNDVLTEATVRHNASTTEYLAMVGLFGFLVSLAQALIFEWDAILEFFGRDPDATSTCSLSQGWGLMAIFVAVVLGSYMGASRFLMMSEAAFFNLSLLTGDLWSVAFSIVAEKIVPGPLFFVALVFVLGGVVLYEMAPHPVVEDTSTLVTAQQLAEIDNEFELQETHENDNHEGGDDDYDDENDMELL